MAMVRLQVIELLSTRIRSYVDETGSVHRLPFLRLMTDVVLGSETDQVALENLNPIPAILDTGCPRTILPLSIWRPVQDRITRLAFSSEEIQQGPNRLIAGGSYSYFLGRIWMGLLDPEGRRLPAVPVIAEFIEDEAFQFPSILIGLWGGILDGRRLWREPTLAQQEPAPNEEDASAQTPEFGQRWWLADG